jgi:hypothetical protein
VCVDTVTDGGWMLIRSAWCWSPAPSWSSRIHHHYQRTGTRWGEGPGSTGELLCLPIPCRLGRGSLWQHPWWCRRLRRCKSKTLSPTLCHQEVSYQTIRYSALCSSCDRQLAVTNVGVLTQKQCAGRGIFVCVERLELGEQAVRWSKERKVVFSISILFLWT